MTAQPTRSHDCDVIVIGAGPYGLAVTAHLKARGVATHVFGEPMSFWQHHMPKGMRLRSPWGATHISDPAKALTLDTFLAGTGGARVEPLPLDTFIAYGTWFQTHAAPNLDRRKVERIEAGEHGFRVVPTDGKPVQAPRVVVAIGLAHQEFRPEAFARVPQALASHSSDHQDFDRFRGKRVGVVGRGQSACESAALLHEAGAEVEIICRGPIHWLGDPRTAANRRAAIVERLAGMLATPSGVGPFPLNWMIEFPGLVHLLPDNTRAKFNAASLRAGAAGWLRPRFGGITVEAGAIVAGATEKGGRIEVQFAGRSAIYDHVLLATGYRTDVARLGLFKPDLLGAIACRDGAPILSSAFESSVPGLHFAGSSAVASVGPLMRFVAGTHYAARQIARAADAGRHSIRQTPAGALESDLAA